MSKALELIEQRLTEYNAKPLLPLELFDIKKAFSRSDVSLESFKAYYRRDPIFCWYLVNAAREATLKRPTHPFAADHAMSILGISGARKLLAPLKPTRQPKLSDEVVFSLTTSLLAAELAKEFGKTTSNKPQTYWTTLFYQLPDTLLWYLQPKAMWRIYYRQLSLPSNMSLFEESKLGFNLHDWRIAVADTFHMDEQLKILYSRHLPTNPKELFIYAKQGYSNKTPSLEEWHKQEAFLVVLCNRLAKAIIAPWHNRGYQHVSELLKQLLATDQRTISRVVQTNVAKVSRNLNNSKLISPAVGYLLQPGKPAFPEWLVKPLLHSASKASSEQKLSNLVKKLTTLAHEYETSGALVHEGMKAFISELHFSRVSFLGIDYKTESARTKIALNAEGTIKIRPDFEFKTPTPLSKFIDKQSFMVISREQHKKIWHKLPQAIQKQQVDQFIMCSLQPGKRVKAIIYLDSKDGDNIDSKKLSKVKVLLQAINKGLMQRNVAKNGNK